MTQKRNYLSNRIRISSVHVNVCTARPVAGGLWSLNQDEREQKVHTQFDNDVVLLGGGDFYYSKLRIYLICPCPFVQWRMMHDHYSQLYFVYLETDSQTALTFLFILFWCLDIDEYKQHLNLMMHLHLLLLFWFLIAVAWSLATRPSISGTFSVEPIIVPIKNINDFNVWVEESPSLIDQALLQDVSFAACIQWSSFSFPIKKIKNKK